MKTRTKIRAASLGVCLVISAALGGASRLRRGATQEEVQGSLPGDDLIPDADLTATRAITIHCRPEAVWPWVAQLGQGRGGLYSYDFLENLVGCHIHSADRIVPEWQHIVVGDEVRLAPDVALTAAVVEPGRTLVVRGGVPVGSRPAPYDFTWAFALRELTDGSTRLLVRERYMYSSWWARPVVAVAELISEVMSRKMMQGIRDRAERSPHLPPEVAASPGETDTRR